MPFKVFCFVFFPKPFIENIRQYLHLRWKPCHHLFPFKRPCRIFKRNRPKNRFVIYLLEGIFEADDFLGPLLSAIPDHDFEEAVFEGGVFVIVDVPEDKGLAEVFFEEIFFLEEFEEDVEGVEEFGLVERVGIFFHS